MDEYKIIEYIKRKMLPLDAKLLDDIRQFCNLDPNFEVLGEIPFDLRRDWVDHSIDPFTRACKHTKISASDWRRLMEEQCSRTITHFLLTDDFDKTVALLIWRAALAYVPTLHENNIKMCHMRVKRDEETLQANVVMPLSEKSKKLISSGKYCLIVPDPMLGTGSSSLLTIRMLNDLGISNENITILCVVAAPEGVFHLLVRCPGVRIVSVTLDGQLNEDGYIINDGLGDAGDKYFCDNEIGSFVYARHCFSDEEWKYLSILLED
jgi:uracil phosphoribosyltransferase